MLKPLPFEGTVKVINKGVDAALVIGKAEEEAALRAAKICGVRGISTAVLQIPESAPADRETFRYYSGLAGVFVFADKSLYERCRSLLSDDDRVQVAGAKDEKSFAKAVWEIHDAVIQQEKEKIKK